MDATHDPKLRSFVESANGHPDFPLQNLPLGVFAPPGGRKRGGVAIGDKVLDLGAIAALLQGEAERAAEAASGEVLNPLFALGAGPRRALRAALSRLLAADSAQAAELRPHLYDIAACTLHLPARIGDYTDFYAGIHHATNAGKLFRPDSPLLPNYKHVPVAYHGRASTVRVSGSAVRRPMGQRKLPGEEGPSFGPCLRLDYEMEFGIWIGPGNDAPIPIGRAAEHIAGFCLLNDWSARDIQAWEAQPLGPFLAKNFQTSISPWVVTPEALAPFRIAQPARPAGDPKPLDYLWDAADQAGGALDLAVEVLLQTQQGGPFRLSIASTSQLYWTFAQMVAHHTVGGCALAPGDLFGSGTISAPSEDGYGALLELTYGGQKPVRLPNGEERRFLEDGDTVSFRARAARDGYAPIGFGECRGTVLPAA
ncbi:fumarylacetoacetase [Siccirubricoccus sp. KC 17139]|uniref:fumarylacetoacetase n=1 Tax=Siccirubricoccus soli TaxID=2899147 RepID=A0ABT1DA65_9PROT|nr:fumarylacetoacetase [Siccirubricoccus soli]MCO6418803.1 fumarylacetoacetase [Siccirubricoccus soli]MCP2684938.1 fumarylacetoacetase [Siccirubricoccus soli]